VKILECGAADFEAEFSAILKRAEADNESIEPKVRAIIDDTKKRGAAALLEQIAQFDRWNPKSFDEIVIERDEIEMAWRKTPPHLRDALTLSRDRIRAFHERQKPHSWLEMTEAGWLGQKVTPVDRAGIYVPGGKAAYPSTLLMNAVPAAVAGVGEIIVCSPAIGGNSNPLTLAAAHLCDVSRIFKIGGAGAIAAMAFGVGGDRGIPKVDVITGPGNIFVAIAKKLVFGAAQIDMIAGPSEVCVIADSAADAGRLAVDLLSQAEHDEMASAILITTDRDLARRVLAEIENVLKTLDREAIARVSIDTRGAAIVARNLDEAADLANMIAPEHLEILTANPRDLLEKIRHAGAIFLGEYSPEAVGDYAAGPNHTLPTGGTARFFSPLGTENFMKKSSVIAMNKNGFDQVAKATFLLAEAEGLTAHALSVKKRM
jgi:histidinol dehydrogenase